MKFFFYLFSIKEKNVGSDTDRDLTGTAGRNYIMVLESTFVTSNKIFDLAIPLSVNLAKFCSVCVKCKVRLTQVVQRTGNNWPGPLPCRKR